MAVLCDFYALFYVENSWLGKGWKAILIAMATNILEQRSEASGYSPFHVKHFFAKSLLGAFLKL